MIKNMSVIEKNGTGIDRQGSSIEKNGTGVSAFIEKNGTGIRFGRVVASTLLASVLCAPAMAADFKGMVNKSGDQLTVSITDGSLLLSGVSNLNAGYSVVSLNSIELGMRVDSEGNGTGVASEGNGTGRPSSEGNGTGYTKSEGNGTGVASEGNGTGVASEGNGTGVASEGNGTGVASEGNGTGIASEGNGTGIASEGNGTGVARFCLSHPGVLSEGNGTGIASEGNGTGFTKSEGNGTGVASEGNGTGVASEGNGTGFATDSRGPVSFVISPIGGSFENGGTAPAGCDFETVTLSWGLAEVALNGNTASILLYGVRNNGVLVELAALELPVLE